MDNCKGRSVSDAHKIPFIIPDGKKLTPKFYHLPILCSNEHIASSDLCGKCLEKEKILKSCHLVNTSLKNSSGRIASHPSVLHGRIDDPIPIWSHLENGQWFKNMLAKGYKVMPPKKQQQTNIDESKVLIEALKLSGKNADKVAKLIELFPSLTKSAALNAVVKANKPHRESKIKDTSKDVENVIQSLQTKLYIDATKESQEIYEVVKVIIKPIVIDNKKYFYDSNKN